MSKTSPDDDADRNLPDLPGRPVYVRKSPWRVTWGHGAEYGDAHSEIFDCYGEAYDHASYLRRRARPNVKCEPFIAPPRKGQPRRQQSTLDTSETVAYYPRRAMEDWPRDE